MQAIVTSGYIAAVDGRNGTCGMKKGQMGDARAELLEGHSS